MDLIPSIDSDAEIDIAPSSEDERPQPKALASKKGATAVKNVPAPVPAARQRPAPTRGGISWEGLADSDDDNDAAEAEAAPKAARKKPVSAWSFQEAIAKIDSSSNRASYNTSLGEKVAQIRARSDRLNAFGAASEKAAVSAAAAAEAGKKRKRLTSSEVGKGLKLMDGEEVEEVPVTDEEDGAPGAGSDSSSDSEGESGDDSDEDGSDDESDDDDDDGEEEEAAGPEAGAASDEDSEGASDDDEGAADADDGQSGDDSDGGDVVEEDEETSKPNPFRVKSSGSSESMPQGLADEYAKFFAPDPFTVAKAKAAAAAAAARKRGGAAAAPVADGAGEDSVRVKKSMTAAQAAAAAGVAAGTGVGAPTATVSGLADGSALKEPTSFPEMNLCRPLLRAVTALGYKEPTPIQRRVVPLALAGHDICGSAVTGSGKTAAYLLPILERLQYKPSRVPATRVLILVPTRELAVQVHSMARQLGQFCPGVTAACVVGGVALKQQEVELRARPDIVVATPGRLLDHLTNSLAVHADDVDVLVLDEADRLLEMGFEEEVSQIVKACPVGGRQTLLFSATMTARVETLVKLSLRKPVRVTTDPLYDMAERLSQEFVRIKPGREGEREALLLALATRSFTGGGVLIFAVHKYTAHRLAILLALAGLSAAELHGNLTQRQRLAALEDFREARVDYLIATDLAGRGLDIAGVKTVINFEMPRDLTSYVHRVGRTARAGRSGVAVTLVSESQRTLMKEVVKRAALNVKARSVPPDVVASWRAKIEAWAPDIEEVAAAERSEREARRADMEATKGENLLEHADEIGARPARTWFQSGTEKEASRRAAAVAAGVVKSLSRGGEDGEEGAAGKKGGKDRKEPAKPHRLTRKKRRRMEAEAEMEREERSVARRTAAAEKASRDASDRDGSDDEEGGRRPQKRGRREERGGFDSEENPALLARDQKRLALYHAATKGAKGNAKKAKAALRAKTLATGMTDGQLKRIEKRQEAFKKRAEERRAGGGREKGGGGDDDGDESHGGGGGEHKAFRASSSSFSSDRGGAKGKGGKPGGKGGKSAGGAKKNAKSSKRFKRH